MPSPSATAAAFYVSALASYDEIKAMLPRYDRTSTAGLLLSGTIWQCEGDVHRAESALRRAAENASADDRAYVVDVLAPLLISRGLFARAAALLGTVTSPNLELGRRALQSVIDAATGAVGRSEECARAIRAELPRIDDDIVRMRVHQRLALAAYWRRDIAEALDEAAAGIRSARLLNAHRFAVTLHSVAYAAHQTCTGDVEAAWRHARALAHEADLGGDASYRAWGRVTLYELAAERGDDVELAAARAALDAEPLPEQYRERFSAGIADALRLAWQREFATARNVLIVLKDTTGRTDGERALCRALLAVASLALHDDDAARRFSRQAISSSARPERHLAAHELRYHRLARALASATGEIVGDVVRGRRAAAARFLHGDSEVAALAGLRRGAPLDSAPKCVRGYARFLSLARAEFESRPAAGPLTSTEVDVLKLLDSGRNAPQIAALLDRSPHTVRTHLRNASAKLETHGRAETLTRARQLGLLAEPRTTHLGGAST
ncbi:MAG TPA: LuxR C-terminal-related transcriptional regulator [Candidatus Elarobacter sp.]